ncbi:MAG TPA: hypothetical protein VE616_19880 [Candidatus Udaeobacter sp.]|jgi:hypothetical protein|nr:hypothetical protein [Candidatus Udaeobacter sp.]
MEAASKRTILRIELWHALLLLGLLASLGRIKMVEPVALLMGGLFMGLNFFLLSFGVAWVLTPLASRGRVKLGIALLVLKVAIFLALLITIFFRFEIDAISFSLGFSSLLLAIVVEAVRASVKLGL